jgi:hypothetical protein
MIALWSLAQARLMMSELLTRAKDRPGTESEDNDQTVVNVTHVTTCDQGEGEVVRNRVRIDDPVKAAAIIARQRAG